jgi:hypothetical protein
MPTIEELFKSKKLASGKTAQEQYDIRNTKATPITTYNPLLSYTPGVLQKLRSGTDKMKESKIESETSGLRVLSTLSSPVLYGTDIIRLTRKSTNMVNTMKGATNGDASGGGLLGKIGNSLNTLASKIGISFPEDIIPSKLYLNKDFNTGKDKGGEGSTMEILSKIKSKSGGNFLGNFLKGAFESKPSNNTITGNALDGARNALNKLSLGSRKQGAQNLAQQSKEFSAVLDTGAGFIPIQFRYTPYDSLKKYSSTVDKTLTEDGIDTRRDLSSLYNNFNFDSKPIGPNNYPLGPYTNQNVLKFPKSKWTGTIATNEFNIDKKLGITYGTAQSINGQVVQRGNRDYYNSLVPYKSETGLKADKIGEGDPAIDSYDFVALKFWSVYKKSAVNFRATISGLTETISPSWDTNKFVGNPFNFYTYNGIERTVSFNFKVYSLHNDEHIAAWQRLSFLTSLTYPQGYPNNFSVAAPFIKFTLGDMFRNKEAYIESLSYTIDDNSPWDIGIDKTTKDFKLPKIIDVAITLKLVETVGSTYEFPKVGKQLDASGNPAKDAAGKPLPDMQVEGFTKRLYGYGGRGAGNPIEIDTEKMLNPDGSPKDGEMLAEVVVTAKRNKNAASPEEQKPQAPEDPKGTFVTEYKGLKLYETENGPFKTITSYRGDATFHTGPANAAASRELLISTEKLWIDERLLNEKISSDVRALVTPPL